MKRGIRQTTAGVLAAALIAGQIMPAMVSEAATLSDEQWKNTGGGRSV